MNDAISRELRITDYLDGGITEQQPTKENTKPLPEAFGRNLDTLEKARLWLTNPHNWHSSSLFILKWDGLIPTVDVVHAKLLLDNPQDDGLPWCVVFGQAKRRERGARGEQMEENLDPVSSE
jgi:hypothetical protein